MKDHLVIFFVPPEKIVNGGIMSIFSQCKESRQRLNGSEFIICTYPGSPSYVKNDLFNNDEHVYSFEEVMKKWPNARNVLFHIPEVAIVKFVAAFRGEFASYIENLDQIEINIMNQNIKLMPGPSITAQLFQFCTKITQTAAHERYVTQEMSDKYQMPVHHLSVFIDSSQYTKATFLEKKDIIAYSSDKHPRKDLVLSVLAKHGKYSLVEINNLSYEQYKKLVREAKFVLTFGEGMDGYLIESYFSGSVGLAVYNDDFFPNEDFKKLKGIFTSYETLAESIISTLEQLDDEANYNNCVKTMQEKLTAIYRFDRYLSKIEKFYDKTFDFYPDHELASLLIGSLARSSSDEIDKLVLENKDLAMQNRHKARKLDLEKERILSLKSKISEIENSKSWKVTSPLRKLSGLIDRNG